MDKKIVYLHVLEGSQSGSSIILEPGKNYRLANNFDADVYIRCSDDDNIVQTNIIIENDGIEFNNIAGSFSHMDKSVETNIKNTFPFICCMGGVNLIFTFEPEYVKARDYFTSAVLLNTPAQLSAERDGNIAEADGLIDDALYNEVLEADNGINGNFSEAVTTTAASEKITFKKIAYNVLNTLQILYSRLLGRFGRTAVYSVCGFGVIILVGLLLSVYQYTQQEQFISNGEEQVATNNELKKVLLSIPQEYQSLSCSKTGNKYLLSGIVETPADLNRIKIALKAFAPDLEYKVWVFTNIHNQLISILKENNIKRANAVFNSANYSVELSGLTDNTAQLDSAQIAIDSKFSQIGEMDTSHVFVAKNIDNDIDNMFNPNNHGSELNVYKDYESGVISITGYMSDDEKRALNDKFKAFDYKYSPVVTIDDRIQDSIKALPFIIEEVCTGDDGWVMTDDGQRIYQGGEYKGVTLVSIDATKIVFKNKFLLTVALNQLTNFNNRQLSYSLNDKSIRISAKNSADMIQKGHL